LAFSTTDTFEAGALAAVNLGDDADTTGAIYGQLAGAYYGLAGIPERWRSTIALQDRILGLSDALWSLASSAPG
jgi:ADP-ribosyl-[dinitrogen reductase] hydrolase